MIKANLTTPIYLAQLEDDLQRYQAQPVIATKIKAVQTTVSAYQQDCLPTQPLPHLEFSEQLVFDLLNTQPDVLEVESRLNDLRQCVIENFGIWHIFSKAWLTDFAAFLKNRPAVQLMAGNGVLASQLAGVIATDNLNWAGQDVTRPQPWTDIEQLDALAAVKKYYQKVAVFILEWAPDGEPIDLEILRFLRTHHWQGDFIVIGEKGGATNSAGFWQAAKLNRLPLLNVHHRQFDFIDDQVYLVE